MDELVKQVAQKVGISEEMAKTAVETVINFLKDKLPDPIARQLDNIMGGQNVAGNAGDLLQGLGGLLGKK